MKSYLKVKIKSLAAEARIIRMEERRVNGRRRWVYEHQGPAKRIEELNREFDGLHYHRVMDVRRESRAAQLAYAFIRGRDYKSIEPSGYGAANIIGRIAELASKYGALKRDESKGRIAVWIKGEEYVAPEPKLEVSAPRKKILGLI